MNVVLEIPDGLGHSLADSPEALRRRIALDLARYYYAERLVSIGKATELSGLSRGDFEAALAESQVERNYSKEDLDADLKWARGALSAMNEPGLDNRHRDKNPPKAGEIQQKRGDTINKNLPKPIKDFSPNARLDTMRKETGQTSVEKVREAAKHRR
jgi:predicted HTH domain antitoxin